MIPALKTLLLPGHPVPMRILRGPFRGARVMLNPRTSMRKALGLYEHELNPWLAAALPRVHRVIDVGANDGYFTFGSLAAFRRRGVWGDVIAFEPQEALARQMREHAEAERFDPSYLRIVQAFVGNRVADGTTTLDALPESDRDRTLIKIDVEGAEIDVIEGAASWLTPGNLFVIEVHKEPYLEALTRTFAERGLRLRRVDQRPLPLLGREVRDVDNWWLVSEIPGEAR